MRFVAVVLPCEFVPGRWLVCRRNQFGWTTAVTDHPSRETAERERRALQAEYDMARPDAPVFDPFAPRQLVLGFYGREQGDT